MLDNTVNHGAKYSPKYQILTSVIICLQHENTHDAHQFSRTEYIQIFVSIVSLVGKKKKNLG